MTLPIVLPTKTEVGNNVFIKPYYFMPEKIAYYVGRYTTAGVLHGTSFTNKKLATDFAERSAKTNKVKVIVSG